MLDQLKKWHKNNIQTREVASSLNNFLNRAAVAYYDKDQPIISDSLYDKLYLWLQEIQAAHNYNLSNPILDRVAGKPSDQLEKKKHIRPMLSIENAFENSEVAKWCDDILAEHSRVLFTLEYKMDGVALSLRYDNGHLQHAVTRGNGVVGEDVTKAARMIYTIPLTIPNKDSVEVRGEVCISFDEFERINRRENQS